MKLLVVVLLVLVASFCAEFNDAVAANSDSDLQPNCINGSQFPLNQKEIFPSFMLEVLLKLLSVRELTLLSVASRCPYRRLWLLVESQHLISSIDCDDVIPEIYALQKVFLRRQHRFFEVPDDLQLWRNAMAWIQQFSRRLGTRKECLKSLRAIQHNSVLSMSSSTIALATSAKASKASKSSFFARNVCAVFLLCIRENFGPVVLDPLVEQLRCKSELDTSSDEARFLFQVILVQGQGAALVNCSTEILLKHVSFGIINSF